MKVYRNKNFISLIIFIFFIIIAIGSTGGDPKKCQLSGCDRTGKGWRYYTGSDLGSYSYSCVRLGPSTGHSYNYTYCSKSHCIADR